MKQQIRTFLWAIISENNSPSLTRSLAVLFAAAFLIASFYLLIRGQHWDHYADFAYITGGGGIGTQVANKIANNKYGGNSNDK